VGRRSISILLLVLLLCALSFGQGAGKAKLSYKLIAVHVKGVNHYKEDQIVSAAGLHLGQMVAENDFKAAIDRLGSTGLFNDVAYSYQYSTAGCNLEIQLTENDKLAPVVFDNFVWFSDDELFSLLRSHLPLFEDKLPLGGSLSDQVSDALNEILVERKIGGKAEYIRGAAMNGPVDSYIYKVSFHPVVVQSIEFPGAAQTEVPALQAAGKQVLGKNYLRSEMEPQEKYSLLPVYLARGYLKVHFEEARPKVVSDGPQTMVDVSFPVTPGTQYKLTGIEWTGNTAFPTDQLQKLVPLKTGEPANAVQLQQDIEAVQKLYGTKGYLAAQVHPDPAMDDTQATVHYTLNVREGDVYRMADLEIDGVADDVVKRMTTQWQMKKGDPFDDSYLSRFFSSMYRDATLSRSLNVAPKRIVNQSDKTVSVVLHFVPK
jgi:outer membrane protein insertion porin family